MRLPILGIAGSLALTVGCASPTADALGSVARIDVTAAQGSLLLGSSTEVTAVARDAQGGAVAGVAFTWSSTDETVAEISGSGSTVSVHGRAEGQARIRAAAEGVMNEVALTVTRVPVDQVRIEPATLTVTAGQSAQLTATTLDAAGGVLAGRVVTWTSSNTAAATVSSSGLVTAQGAGAATITATSEGRSGTAQVTVTNVAVASVTVAPTSASLTVGQTQQLTATMRDASGNVLTGRAVTWTSSNTAAATVSSSGLVTAQGAGTATITATSEGRSGTAQVTVSQVPVATVTVAPTSASLTVGQTQQLTATMRDAGGNVLTGRAVTWASSNTAAATVSSSGLVTAQGAGAATITATSEGRSGTAQVTVSQVPVATVTVAPTSASLTVGQTQQLTATTRDASGNVLTGRAVTWTSSNTAAATVSSSGLVTAQGAGAATITATSEGRSGTAQVSVTGTGGGDNYALQFFANVLNGQGRVTIRLDAPARPVDVGATDFTIEFWLRGRAADNTEGSVPCGLYTDAWIEGNIILDRDRFTQPRDYGLALLSGRVAFGVRTASDIAYTLCGSTSVLDDQWHHIAVTRRTTGAIAIFIDGRLDASDNGPSGDVSYPDGAAGASADPYLVLAAEKHDVGLQYPGFRGLLDEMRLSTTVRYTANFTRPSRRFTPDAQTAALYHFDEGTGTTLGDASGAPGGPSTGTLSVGGSPAGPVWVTSTAPTGP